MIKTSIRPAGYHEFRCWIGKPSKVELADATCGARYVKAYADDAALNFAEDIEADDSDEIWVLDDEGKMLRFVASVTIVPSYRVRQTR